MTFCRFVVKRQHHGWF